MRHGISPDTTWPRPVCTAASREMRAPSTARTRHPLWTMVERVGWGWPDDCIARRKRSCRQPALGRLELVPSDSAARVGRDDRFPRSSRALLGALGFSAKGTVDGDFAQCGLKEGELSIIKLGDE